MVSIRGRFEYPDGLIPGQSKDGGLHQNLYNSQGRLTDHGTFFPDNENEADSLNYSPPVVVYVTNEYEPDSRSKERDERAEWISELISPAVDYAVARAEPYVKRWWNNQAVPAM
jgi:hypothetical protein